LLLIASGVSFVNNNLTNPSQRTINTAIGLGIGSAVLILVGYFSNKNKIRHLKNAVAVYNQ
jgi:hypothetical protein